MINDAKWIKSSENEKEACYEFYENITLSGKVKKATLYASAMGMYRAFIDGKRVGDELFTPYWTAYNIHTQYQSYDVTDMLSESFELCFICAEGWAVGQLDATADNRNHYAKNIALIYSLDIELENGETVCFSSGDKTRVRTSHILSSSIYHGEVVDKTAKKRELGFSLPDKNVSTALLPQYGEAVRETDVISPVRFFVTPKGERVIDFGQNFAGYVKIILCGKRGDKIRISHAEILDRDGNFYNANYRAARAENTYILSGDGEESFCPSFSWQGFRYIRLDEFPTDKIDLNQFRGIVVHSDLERTGDFSCGNEKINQLYHNVIWGQKSNFIDVPTDCPQRNERYGWTGDAQVFVRTAAINYDVEKFFSKWLSDLAAEQKEDGAVTALVPSIGAEMRTSAAWGDASVICPWEIYLAYGNRELLSRQFESMKKWVDYIHNFGEEEYLWIGGNHFGDWLGMDNEDGSYMGATPHDYIASAFFAHSTEIVIKAGKILGFDITEYEELHGNILKAFRERFVKDGLPVSKTQTAYALALYFGLLEDPEKTAKGLCELVESNGTRLTTGFVGTPYLLHALSENGYTKTAYNLLLQEAFPSWLFSVNQGATTIWEHWDGIREDGSVWDEKMNSFNHYAYGSVYDWIFGVAAGIKPLEDGAGYRHIKVEPCPDERLGFLNASLKTRLGQLSSSWSFKDDVISYEIEIPKGAKAEICLPNRPAVTVGGGKYLFTVQK